MESNKRVIRILLADDHVLIRHGIKNIIKADERLQVAGEAASGEELVNFLLNHEVDLVILDITMPGTIGGMESISLIKSKYPSVKVLMLTMNKTKQSFFNAMTVGADGYLMKDDPDHELLIAIHKVLSGRTYISPFIAKDFTDDAICKFRNERKNPFQELTKREKEILHLVVKGMTSKQMAEHLHLSQRTIDNHRANLLRKFNRRNSIEMAEYAIRTGLVSPD